MEIMLVDIWKTLKPEQKFSENIQNSAREKYQAYGRTVISSE